MKADKYILVSYLVLIIACNSKDNANFKRIEDIGVVYGKVKSIRETLYSLKEKFGELKKDGVPSNSYYWFDENTNLIKEQTSESTWDSTLFKYDNEHKLIEEDYYDEGIIQAKRVYEYSNENTKRKESYIYKNILHISVSIFDRKMNKIELNEYEDDGTPSTKHIYQYDSKSNLIKETYQFPNEKINQINYKYDGKNNKIEEKREGVISFTYKFEKIDKFGNWLKQTAISDDPFYVIERKIDYY